ncbi:hypothetical protein BO71DRAFT_22747 [Aspergillus ellipticus CBS 707.79]|uniref:Vacuolar ATPase assembly protein VMA22 n=1 Tax=Aspergillus ellipticus CBS 707.79 TaxID=1448320 RepID=A0A319ED82_9EURO|nr:hypothetical protein BO71DRAFT_22747 [Aspergillus ellipticus CBS 707.79]
MAQIPTPPASRSASPAADAEPKQPPVADSSADLLQSLDSLLERYLHLLDQHQKLQAELGSQLSSGFFSLAQANYTCPPGRHYGADYYDERMKATKRVTLEPPSHLVDEKQSASQAEDSPEPDIKDGDSRPIFAIESVTIKHPEEESETEEKTESDSSSSQGPASGPEEGNQSGEPLTTAEPQAQPDADADTDAKPRRSKKKFRSSDPIHWYGILVPPYLRSAQKSFTEAVESRLPQLASAIAEMQIVEKEVTRVRKELDRA